MEFTVDREYIEFDHVGTVKIPRGFGLAHSC